MAKVFGALLIGALLWLGLELYQEGPHGAFGGALSSFVGDPPPDDATERRSAPRRAGDALERAHADRSRAFDNVQ